jgi:hypothetical protein
LEESTEENSDSHWMSIKNLKKRGSDHGFTDSGEASSGPSTAKNLKYILEESTEENSDSHWMSIKNLKKRGSDHGFKKRKSAHLEDSSSSETEDKEKFLSLKKTRSLVLPSLSLKFNSSETNYQIVLIWTNQMMNLIMIKRPRLKKGTERLR